MGVNFGNVEKLVIPEGEVVMITSGDTVLWQKQRIPQLYQEVEYISAASGQAAYIDLGITYNQGCTFEIGLLYTMAADYFGVFQTDGKRARIDVSDSSVNFNVGYSKSKSVFVTLPGLTAGESYVLKGTTANNNVRFENITTGDIKSSAPSADVVQYTCTENMYLLGWNYKGAPRTLGTRTVKSFRYWDKDDNLLRDMVPCYRRSDNVIGMFDLVSQAFFTNAGTGVFTVGEDVT